MSQGSKLEDFVTLHQFGPNKYVQLTIIRLSLPYHHDGTAVNKLLWYWRRIKTWYLELLHVSHIFYCFPSVSFLNYFMIDYHVFRNISREKRESDDSKRKIWLFWCHSKMYLVQKQIPISSLLHCWQMLLCMNLSRQGG